MKSPLQFKKDYYGGALMAIIGLSAAYASVSYRLGSLDRMGPGYFPCVLGVMLAITGVLIALTARRQTGPAAPSPGHAPKGMPDLRGGICIIVAILAFLLLGEYLGLLPATFAITFIAAWGDRDNTVLQSFLLALAMVAIAVVVFWWALQMQMPLVKWEF
jgi:hypothetical protein